MMILARPLQALHYSLIGSEKTCFAKRRAIQQNLYMVRLTIVKIDGEPALINFDQSDPFVSVDHRLLEASFLAVCSGPYNFTCMSLPVRWQK